MDESQFDDLEINDVAPGGVSDEEVTGPLPDDDPTDGNRPVERLELEEVIGGTAKVGEEQPVKDEKHE